MIDKKLNINRTIQEILPVVKEKFIQFYGEEYRDMIETKFQNCTYLGYSLPNNIEALLSDLSKEKSLELVKEFFATHQIEDNEENIRNYFGYDVDFRYFKSTKLYSVFNYLLKEEHSSWEVDEFQKFLKNISGHDEIVEGSELYQELVGRIQEMKSSFDKMVMDFKNFYSNYDKYVEYVKNCNLLKFKIRDKYEIGYLREIYDYMDLHDKELVDNVGKNFRFSDLHCYGILCGSLYSSKTLIDAFSSESTEKVNHFDEINSYILNSIYSDRINYFKKMGIDLGEDYEAYKNDERCLKVMPSCEMVDKLIGIRENYVKMEEKEYITSTSLYQEQLEEIEKLGLLDKNVDYCYDKLLNGITCINPNVRKVGDNYQIYSLLLFATR